MIENGAGVTLRVGCFAASGVGQNQSRGAGMDTVFRRIDNLGRSLTRSEALAADYLRAHPSEIISHSIHESARRAGVSVASVSRLALRLGYRDWKEMRVSLIRDSSRVVENPVFSDITPADSDAAVAKKVFDGAIVSLHDTLKQLDSADVSRVVSAIKNTNRIVFFGSGGSGCIARDESLRFSHLELSAEAYSEEFQMMLQAARMKKGQIAFGFSNSGRSGATVSVLGEARSNQALTVGVGNYRNTPLEDVSDIFFCTAFSRRGGITAALTARIAMMCVMDVIYVLAAHHGLIADKVGYIDAKLEKNLRLAARPRAGGARAGRRNKRRPAAGD